jgi:multidrug efflux pump subunit AcrB
MVPIAMASGIGAVNRIGIGAASVGGIISAGILTVLVIPILYVRCVKKH